VRGLSSAAARCEDIKTYEVQRGQGAVYRVDAVAGWGLVYGSISTSWAMVEDVVRVVAAAFQRISTIVPAFSPFLHQTLMACRTYAYGMAAS
jgi:hypothetical protein